MAWSRVMPSTGRRTLPSIRRVLVHGAAALGLGVALLAATASPAGAQTKFAALYAGTTTLGAPYGKIQKQDIGLVVNGYLYVEGMLDPHEGEFAGVGQKTVVVATQTFNGSYTFTFANGDTLTATAQGARKVCTASGVFCSQEILTITGGTGVYEGASGDGIGMGVFDDENNQTGFVLSGTINTAPPAAR